MDQPLTNDQNRPQRRTALVASELCRYIVDIAALSETRLADENSLQEMGSDYTFFWKGLPKDSQSIHGVGFAVQTLLLNRLSEAPVGANECLMTLRLPLMKQRFVTLISCYAPTLSSPDKTKNRFYEELDNLLHNLPKNEKVILLGDFNARVGSNFDVWQGVIGRHGTGKENSNGIRLLNLCSTHDLTITNTVFQLPNKYKMSWIHPPSKHRRQIIFIITRKADLRDFLITRALRGAECWTDHRLIRSIVSFQIRPPIRKQTKKKQIDRAMFLLLQFHNQDKLTELQTALHSMAIIKAFHDGMTAHVCMGGNISNSFAVIVGVKQGCVLAPILFNIYLAAVTLLARYKSENDSIAVNYRLDGNLFKPQRLKAKTKARTAYVFDMQHADDAAYPAPSPQSLQRNLDAVNSIYSAGGLVMNASKTEVLPIQHNTAAPIPPFNIGGKGLKTVESFKYLGSILSATWYTENEIHTRIILASSSFGKLSKRVFLNRALTVETKIKVYQYSQYSHPRVQQVDGVAMGTLFGVLFANFFMGCIEEEVLNKIENLKSTAATLMTSS
ncbi:uncharacterized protein LOC143025717 [Oratosquilla oratoria]|uniref:uncharacterized protein LOC143025717 n=1 Tax=Oratosquilla oratoria TaxID=337810 RepID=UPI003F777243